ncbi:MAG TPA: hypothetical protein VHA75_02565 [Rugosimonospora sp.]|nr:hypothetical protein [Rugosimonospora sp.]
MGWLILGTTDDITTCEVCGKTELRGTVHLGITDADGALVDEVYAGTTCAARRVGARTTAVRNAATTYNARLADARRWAAEFSALYGPDVPIGQALATYARINPRGAAQAAARVLAIRAEIAAVNAGRLAGTRFDVAA